MSATSKNAHHNVQTSFFNVPSVKHRNSRALSWEIRRSKDLLLQFKEPCSLADPGGGGAPGAPPPLTAADLWFVMLQTLIFLFFFSLAPLAIIFKHDFKTNMAKTR